MIDIYGEIPKSSARKIPKDPQFSNYEPDFRFMKKMYKKHKSENVVVIGNGGSINSFRAFSFLGKNITILDSMEPEHLNIPKNSIIIPVSKSGNTVGVLEDLIYIINKGFDNVVPVTGGGALMEMSKRMNWDVVRHPNIGGRFAGITECALFPSLMSGINIKKIYKGARRIYDSQNVKRKLFELSKSLFKLEKNGYDEIYMLIYSKNLSKSSNIITQLIHETTGKNDLGQTIVSYTAPDAQHHTNQRFFGGPKNMIGFFITVKQHKKLTINVPKNLRSIAIRNEKLDMLNGISMGDALTCEFEGVRKATSERKIPYVVMELGKLNEETMGEFIGIWQFIAYYSALIRGQDPFNQPEIERSKEITMKMIKNLKKKNK